MLTDECDRLKIPYLCLGGLFSNTSFPLFFGKARTVHLQEGNYKDENINMGLGFLNSLGPKDVLFVNGSDKFAYFGELMTRFASSKKIEGVVINGATRDNNYTHRADLQIMYKSKTPVDIKGRGRVQSVDKKIVIKGFEVSPETFVFGDSDGVVVINNRDLTALEQAVRDQIEQEIKISEMLDKDVSIFQIIDKFKSF